jgi:Fe(3+) dicitrate transport protein
MVDCIKHRRSRLDPNRTSNFNTRQNGYDISADVLGYPESYYATYRSFRRNTSNSWSRPLQYGHNLRFSELKIDPKKTFEFTSRNTIGSYGLFTNFTLLVEQTKNSVTTVLQLQTREMVLDPT